MDLLFVTSHFGSSETVGFMPVLATALTERGHNVRGVQYERDDTIDSIPIDRVSTREMYTPYWMGQWLFYHDWRDTIRTYLRNTDWTPELVVADRRCMVPTIQSVKTLDIPVVGVVPGLGFTRFNPEKLARDKTPDFGSLPNSAKLQFPFVRALHRQHQKGLSLADNVLVVSEFLQDCLRVTYDVDSTVVRTPVKPGAVHAKKIEPKFITMVNPRSELKGAGIFLNVARSMPDQDFLVAGNFASEKMTEEAEALANVRKLGWVTDMREVYAETELLLVPSLVEEGGPRTIVEAFVNGIPVVGTVRGGIPEFIGNAGETVDPPDDTDAWIRQIGQIQADYAKYSNLAAERSSQFHIDNILREVEVTFRNTV